MAGDWPVKTIAECASAEPYSTQIGPFGKALMADEYTVSGVPVLRGVNVNRGRFHDHDFVFINEESADRLHKFESYPGDVLLVHKGTLGQIGLMPSERRFGRYIMGNSMMRVRCDPAKLLPEYLFYWLSSAEGQHYLFSRISQVGVPQIQTPLTTLRQATLPVPPPDEQRAITTILSSLDDKIDLNRQMAETLDAVARTLFQSWFVDFDPVRSKAEGCVPSLDQSLSHLFPDGFDYSAHGAIPAGWRYSTVGNEIVTFLGGTPKRAEPAYWGGSLPWINSGKANEFRIIEPSAYITFEGLKSSATKMLPSRTTVIAITGATLGQISLTEIETCANQSIVGLLGTPRLPSEFLYFWAKTRRADLVAHQTGGAQQHINKNNVNDMPLLCPPEVIVDAYLTLAKPLFDRIAVCCHESRTLEALRNALLPKLISGALRVPLAERMLEAVPG